MKIKINLINSELGTQAISHPLSQISMQEIPFESISACFNKRGLIQIIIVSGMSYSSWSYIGPFTKNSPVTTDAGLNK